MSFTSPVNFITIGFCLCLAYFPHQNDARRLLVNHHLTKETNPLVQMSYYVPYVEQKPNATSRPTPEAYESLRNMFFRYEESKSLGSDIELNERELEANQIIMAAKIREYDEGFITPRLFKPSQHFFKVLEDIKKTELFRYMSAMPKGAVLHAHDTALCSTDYILTLTYRDNLWICHKIDSLEAVALRFSRLKPDRSFRESCQWDLLSKVRATRGADVVDEYLAEHFTLYPTEKFVDINAAWEQFAKIFMLINGLLMYAPVWEDYYYNALEEFYLDGVQYLEFRTTLPTLYDLNNTTYTKMDTVRIYKETLDKFKTTHPEFIGSRMIYAPTRNTDGTGLEDYIKTLIDIKAEYPDFVAGFDLVGQEDTGRPLKDFIPQLLTIPEHIDFYFHAGETNWFGSSVDENLIDAVLLGTKRIGHGFALVKHPLVLQLLKKQNIAIEVNPISNQVLQLVSDYRNHPCTHLFADNYPVVISSDDPSFWKATPLSHDYYIAFLGISSAHSDLRLLKKLALNSLQYSSLNAVQKADALNKWQQKWDRFIELVITGKESGTSSVHGNHID